jgi:hypothetical protein
MRRSKYLVKAHCNFGVPVVIATWIANWYVSSGLAGDDGDADPLIPVNADDL